MAVYTTNSLSRNREAGTEAFVNLKLVKVDFLVVLIIRNEDAVRKVFRIKEVPILEHNDAGTLNALTEIRHRNVVNRKRLGNVCVILENVEVLTGVILIRSVRRTSDEVGLRKAEVLLRYDVCLVISMRTTNEVNTRIERTDSKVINLRGKSDVIAILIDDGQLQCIVEGIAIEEINQVSQTCLSSETIVCGEVNRRLHHRSRSSRQAATLLSNRSAGRGLVERNLLCTCSVIIEHVALFALIRRELRRYAEAIPRLNLKVEILVHFSAADTHTVNRAASTSPGILYTSYQCSLLTTQRRVSLSEHVDSMLN